MKDLRTWIQVVQSSKFKASSHLNLLLEPGTQMRLLYDALSADRIVEDRDVAREIPELEVSDTVLATLKSKLKERLGDALLLMELNNAESNDRQKAYLDCVKKWTTATILFSKNQRQLGMQKMEQLLRITRRFEFTDITVMVLQVMRMHSSVIFGNEVQYKELNEQLQVFEALRNLEERAENAYSALVIAFVNSKSDKREMAESARIAYAEIEPLLTRGDTYRLHLFGRLLQIAIYDNLNQYEMVIRICEEAITFFDRKPYKSFNVLQAFHYSLLMSYLNLRQYDRCRAVAIQYESLFTRGTYNWFKWQELYFLAEMHDGHYEAAANLWSKATNQVEYAGQLAHIGDSWKIFEGYLYFLTRCGYLKDKKGDKKFRIGKLLNDIHLAQRDKSGMNIPVLVVHYLLALAEKDYGQCIDREESLAKYRTRYLSPADAGRSHYFFRMLELIPKAGFEPVETSRRALQFLEKLRLIPLEVANQNFEVEVIPYETLWNLTLDLLKKPDNTLNPPERRPM